MSKCIYNFGVTAVVLSLIMLCGCSSSLYNIVNNRSVSDLQAYLDKTPNAKIDEVDAPTAYLNQSPSPFTPLIAAAGLNDSAKVRLLIEYRANVNVYEKSSGCTPLFMNILIGGGNTTVVRYLLEAGADVNAYKVDISDILFSPGHHWENWCNDITPLTMIMETNGGNKGWTPLMIAAMRGFTSVISLLLDKGADVNARTETGMTAAMLALRSCEGVGVSDSQLAAAKLILRHAPVNNRDSSVVVFRQSVFLQGYDKYNMLKCPVGLAKQCLLVLPAGHQILNVVYKGHYIEQTSSDGRSITTQWKVGDTYTLEANLLPGKLYRVNYDTNDLNKWKAVLEKY